MTLFQAFFLGLVQGATEFLPISSSAHLVLVPWALGWKVDEGASFTFNVLVHWGTVSAVIVYFRKELAAMLLAALNSLKNRRLFESRDSRLAWLILVASIPIAALGLTLKGVVQSASGNPAASSASLLATAVLLFISQRYLGKARALSSLTVRDSVSIGVAQAIALFPGISRSGATIAAGLTRGLQRQEAAQFSFLLGIPAMLGAGLTTLFDLAGSVGALEQAPNLAVGFLTAAGFGYLAIRWLLIFLTRRPLTIFALYCTVVGIVGLILIAIRG